MAGIVGFIIKLVTSQVIKRLDSIVDELKEMRPVTTRNESELKFHKQMIDEQKERLDDHQERIRTIEIRGSFA